MAKNDKIEAQDLYEFKLMEHVEESPQLSNRQASRILGVSLKLAHDTLTRMVQKGYFHVKKHHARRWDYFLTPKGISEKARLTMEFLDFSMTFYREARKQSAQLCRNLAEANVRDVSFLGAGELAEITYLGMQEWKLHLIAVYDDATAGASFMNRQVLPISQFADDRAAAVIVCMYDASEPMRTRFLPAGLEASDKMRWIFNAGKGPAHDGGATTSNTP